MGSERGRFESREAARLAKILAVPPDNVPATVIEHIDLVVDQLRFAFKQTLERTGSTEVPDHVLDSVADMVVSNAVDAVASKLDELVALGARFSADDLDNPELFETYSDELFDLLWGSDFDRE
jgi:hypothetical protein